MELKLNLVKDRFRVENTNFSFLPFRLLENAFTWKWRSKANHLCPGWPGVFSCSWRSTGRTGEILLRISAAKSKEEGKLVYLGPSSWNLIMALCLVKHCSSSILSNKGCQSQELWEGYWVPFAPASQDALASVKELGLVGLVRGLSGERCLMPRLMTRVQSPVPTG